MENAVVYYFSATGNSLAVARRVARAIDPCGVVPMAGTLKNEWLLECRARRVGLVFPLYYGGLPNLVASFLKKAAFPDAEYLFAVVTAGHNFGQAIREVNGILSSRFQQLSYARYLVMPDNYLPVFNLPPKKVAGILAAGEGRLQETVNDIAAMRTGIEEHSFYLGPVMRAWHRKNIGAVPGQDRRFTADASCTSCGQCEKICPVENIVMKAGRPEWQHHCEQCLACIQFCPPQAIQFGRSTRTKPRYHHPEVTPEDIAQQKSPPNQKSV